MPVLRAVDSQREGQVAFMVIAMGLGALTPFAFRLYCATAVITEGQPQRAGPFSLFYNEILAVVKMVVPPAVNQFGARPVTGVLSSSGSPLAYAVEIPSPGSRRP